jgi:EpsD family peptidyl-prolyl cis-trans isomerase
MFTQIGKPLLLLALVGTAACGDKEPKGSIVAVVNGEEVTLAELNHEAATRNIGNVSDPAMKKALVQEIVSRKLLAQEAVEQEIDRSQNYLLSSKRANEMLLADSMVKSLTKSSQAPDNAAVDEYLRKAGAAAGKQTTFIVEQVVFPRPKDANVLRRLEATKSLEEVQQVLAGASVPTRRMTMPWDSGRMPSELITSLQRLPPGEVFVITAGDPLVAGIIRSQSQIDIPEDQQRAMAAQALQQEKAQRLTKSWLEGSRRSAKISFQPGYEPAAPKGQTKAPAVK